MSNDHTDHRPKVMKLTSRQMIYGAILVLGFILITSGLNGTMEWGMPDMLVWAIGAAVGVAATFALAWLRNR